MFLNLKSNSSFYEFVKNLENKLGFVIDESSFDFSMLRVLFENEKFFEDKVTNALNLNTFENLEGKRLDDFLAYFNSVRKVGGSEDIYEFLFLNNGDKNFLIEQGSKIFFENNFYELIKDEVFSPGKVVLRTKVTTSSNFVSPVFSKDGVVMFDKENIASNTKEGLENYMPVYIKLISANILPTETESDFEFLERSKSVMQSLGFSNNVKLKNELLKDERIKDVVIKDIDGFATVTIFPNNMDELQTAIDYAKEVVDFYKSEHIDVCGPDLVELYIDKLDHQIVFYNNYEFMKEEITKAIENHLRANTDKKVTRSGVVSAISNVLDSFRILADINLSIVELSYRYYNRNNYEEHVLENTITDFKTIKDTSVISFGYIR